MALSKIELLEGWMTNGKSAQDDTIAHGCPPKDLPFLQRLACRIHFLTLPQSTTTALDRLAARHNLVRSDVLLKYGRLSG